MCKRRSGYISITWYSTALKWTFVENLTESRRQQNVNFIQVYSTNNNIQKYRIICDWERLDKKIHSRFDYWPSANSSPQVEREAFAATAFWALLAMMGTYNLTRLASVHRLYRHAYSHVIILQIQTRREIWHLLWCVMTHWFRTKRMQAIITRFGVNILLIIHNRQL